MLHDRTLLKHGSRFTSTRRCSVQPSRAVRPRSCRKARNGAEDEQLTAIQHIHNGKNVFVWLHTARSNLYMGSYCLYRASCPLRKGRSGVLPSTNFETMASHDAGVVYFTEYMSVLFQLAYLDELYGECKGTAHACVNSGYQALFSPITKRLGTRLCMW